MMCLQSALKTGKASSRLNGSAGERGWQEGWPTGLWAMPVRRSHQGFYTDPALHVRENVTSVEALCRLGPL